MIVATSGFSADTASPGDVFYSAIRANDMARLEALVRDGASVNIADEKGITPLMNAAALGSPKALQFLLDKGADVNGQRRCGTPAALKTVTSSARLWRFARFAFTTLQDVRLKSKSGEDRNMQLLGLYWAGTDPAMLKKLASSLIAAQRADGGWAQRTEPESDACATGQTLYTLAEAAVYRPATLPGGRALRTCFRRSAQMVPGTSAAGHPSSSPASKAASRTVTISGSQRWELAGPRLRWRFRLTRNLRRHPPACSISYFRFPGSGDHAGRSFRSVSTTTR